MAARAGAGEQLGAELLALHRRRQLPALDPRQRLGGARAAVGGDLALLGGEVGGDGAQIGVVGPRQADDDRPHRAGGCAMLGIPAPAQVGV